MIVTALVLSLGVAPAAADFAWQWPVETTDASALHRVDLDDAIYARITRSDLGDLIGLNADGVQVPFGPVPGEEPSRTVPAPVRIDVPWFALPRAADRPVGDAIELHIQRDADGRLRMLDTRIGDPTAPVPVDVLLDLGPATAPGSGSVVAIALALDDAATDLRTSVHVLASDDLGSWNRIATALPLLYLRQGGFRLEKLTLDVGAVRARYLLLSPSGVDALPLRAVSVVRRANVQYKARARLNAAASPVAGGDEPGRFEYRSPGPVPVDRIAVAARTTNAVANVVVESRDNAKERWREQARFLVFRVADDAGDVANGPVDIGGTRDRQWRVTTRPALAEAPELTFDYLPDSFVLLAQGTPPYRIAAGSTTRTRAAWPIAELLAPMRAQRGSQWRPPLVRLGAGSALSGDDALQTPSTPIPWRQWALWGVLVGGALAIVVMVVRLLRSPPAG